MSTTNSGSTSPFPTAVMATELDQAFDEFNERLFGGLLPHCLITLQRERATYGYFHHKRFVRCDGQAYAHEIALNPSYFAARTLKATLSTLAHEMVHLWQYVSGRPGRRGYHNREWGARMESIGLIPSDTGAPGGARVGERMSHYILEGGLFDVAATDLLNDAFVLSWIDRFPMAVPFGMVLPASYRAPIEDAPDPLTSVGGEGTSVVDVDSATQTLTTMPATSTSSASISEPAALSAFDLPEPTFRGAARALAWPSDTASRQTRMKYRCPGCGVQVWGKPGLDLRCGSCGGVAFRIERQTRSYGAGTLQLRQAFERR